MFYKADFHEERRDRERARGELERAKGDTERAHDKLAQSRGGSRNSGWGGHGIRKLHIIIIIISLIFDWSFW